MFTILWGYAISYQGLHAAAGCGSATPALGPPERSTAPPVPPFSPGWNDVVFLTSDSKMINLLVKPLGVWSTVTTAAWKQQQWKLTQALHLQVATPCPICHLAQQQGGDMFQWQPNMPREGQYRVTKLTVSYRDTRWRLVSRWLMAARDLGWPEAPTYPVSHQNWLQFWTMPSCPAGSCLCQAFSVLHWQPWFLGLHDHIHVYHGS